MTVTLLHASADNDAEPPAVATPSAAGGDENGAPGSGELANSVVPPAVQSTYIPPSAPETTSLEAGFAGVVMLIGVANVAPPSRDNVKNSEVESASHVTARKPVEPTEADTCELQAPAAPEIV